MCAFLIAVFVNLCSGFLAVQSSSWETPLGRRFDVSSHTDIANLQSQLQPGDYMIMRAGNWENARIALNASGSSAPGRKIYLFPETSGSARLFGKVQIVFSGAYQEVRGVQIDGVSDDKITPVWFEPWSSYGRFTDCAITNFNRDDPWDKKHHWVEMWGSFHTVDYNAFEGKDGTGQLVRVKTSNGIFHPPGAQPESWGHTISHNYFGSRADTEEDDGEGIQIGLRESEFVNTDTIMEFNLFEDYDGEIECISVKASNNIVRHNTFRNSACTVTLRHTDRTTAHDNYFFCDDKARTGGFRVAGEGHRIYNNYVENQSHTGRTLGGIVLHTADPDNPTRRPIKDLQIFRNVIISSIRCLIVGFEHSDAIDADGYPDSVIYRENVMTGKTSSSTILTDINQINPQFERNVFFNGIIENLDDYANGIDVRDPGLVYDDEWGIYRPTDAGFEFDIAYKPLTKDDDRVGPTWSYSY